MKITTLVFLRRPDHMLLAMKKRGFGLGKWNGCGGKLQAGETAEEAAIREAKEEIGVDLKKTDLIRVALLNFSFRDVPEFDQETHVFFAESWQGIPEESEEMRPEWFHHSMLPYDSMWIDDTHWLPLVLAGKKIEARFVFGGKGEFILEKRLKELV